MKGHEYKERMLEIGIKIMPYVDYRRIKRALNKYRQFCDYHCSLKQVMDIIAQSEEELKRFQIFLDERYQQDRVVHDSDFKSIISRVSHLNYEQTRILLNKAMMHKANHVFLRNNGKKEGLWY